MWNTIGFEPNQNSVKFFTFLAIPARISLRFASAAERVFLLLKLHSGHARDLSLADMMQAILMLMYNDRATGHVD